MASISLLGALGGVGAMMSCTAFIAGRSDGTPSGDTCQRAGQVALRCGYEAFRGWPAYCESDATYVACVGAAGDDCQSLAMCGFRRFAATSCGGGGVPAGTADCAATTACQGHCGKDVACVCACNAAMSPSQAPAVGVQNQCWADHCSDCSDKAACDACFSQHCGAGYQKLCVASGGAAAPAGAPPGAGACARDSDCKGDRICDQGQCKVPR